MFSRTIRIAGVLAAACLASTPAFAQRIKAGSAEPYQGGVPAYAAGLPGVDRTQVNVETVTVPGATFTRIHFTEFNLGPGDVLTVSSPDGAETHYYTGRGPNGTGEFWAFTTDGDTAVVTVHAGAGGPDRGKERYGYRIDQVVRGEISLNEEPGDPRSGVKTQVICGTNGNQNVACHLPALDAVNAQRPVARLTFMSGGSSFLCTGWLVRGSNANTLITNNHCVSTQAEVSTVQARFNHQTTTCTGTTLAPVTNFAGNTFLRTNGALDYTLLTLSGNPEATFGELIPTTAAIGMGNLIWVVQHPGGQPKKVGMWEDAAQTQRCNIDELPGGTDFGYACDTQGGSSGSAVLIAGTNRVIGLHHVGISGSFCRNRGVRVAQICTHAGALLTCAP